MTTSAKIGHGSLFAIFDTVPSPAAFVTIGEVTNITLPGLGRDAIDATHTESTQGWREFIPGLKDAGEVKIELNFVANSASDALLRAQFDKDTLTKCRITVPFGSPHASLIFDAVVTGYEVEAPVDDKIAATLSLKVSGKVTYA